MARDADSKSPEQVTVLLQAWSRGDQSAFDQLAPIVYTELRRLARRYMARERADHTLQPTALVHEVYMRLADFHHRDFSPIARLTPRLPCLRNAAGAARKLRFKISSRR